MPRPRNHTPVYKLHKPTGTARCWVDGRWVSLGRYGSPESRREFARVCAEAAERASASPPAPKPPAPGPRVAADLTVAEVLVAFLRHAERHYRKPDGTPTSEFKNFTLSVKPLREAFGHLPAAEFGPLALKEVRREMIDAGVCRKQINKHVGRIKHVFKWAVSEQLVPPAVSQALATVTGLQAGRSAAVESEPVTPVDDATVDATLPHLGRHVRGLVEFQRLTGCRPGEACALRRCDIDTTGDVWVYRPSGHKTAHRGKRRAIPVGPRARALVESFYTDDPNDYLFSPTKAVAEMRAERNANRRTKLYPSQVRRDAANRKADPKRRPADRYSVTSYAHAVRKGVERANRSRRGDTASVPVPAWHPNQLRHAYATRVRKEHGLEAAQVLLGHSTAKVTEVYAERDEARAVAIAARLG